MREKTYCVVGAAGSIGRNVCEQLLVRGARVVGLAHTGMQCAKLEGEIKRDRFTSYPLDVLSCSEIASILGRLSMDGTKFDGLIYAVGPYLQSNFMKEIEKPIMGDDRYDHRFRVEQKLLCLGLYNIVELFFTLLKFRSRIVIAGSSMTHLTADKAPTWLNFWPHVMASACQEKMVEAIRHSEQIKVREMRVDLLQFGPIDTPFYAKILPEMMPKLLDMGTVIDAILGQLKDKGPSVTEIIRIN